MQLKKIKLAGFKSFVEPTTVQVPSHLVAIVGPNGCGKSNVIDAVCWVMGENSAKYLRGESLTDVIFNGSTARKPVGQASVELVFDNNDGSLKGEYASYAEISIRRSLSREGDSLYYLNGARCRRKDIIDIFLGTGLGPRSYSIIGQNMISRIIEAKPDDMRVYLEEAAGISRYKERRRETENRIHHTKENLARLNDIRLELEKQLNHLQRQAGAAEKYKVLKDQERLLRAQTNAILWRQLDAHMVDYTLQIKQQETGLEACQAQLSELDLSLENRRTDHQLATEAHQEVQRRYYLAGNEITRLEQEIRHATERKEQLEHDIDMASNDWQQVHADLETAEDESVELNKEITQLAPEVDQAKTELSEGKENLQSAEDAMQSWQMQWDEFNRHNSNAIQTAHVEQTRIQHLEQRLASIQQRQQKLNAEQSQMNYSELAKEQEVLEKQANDATLQTKQSQDKLQKTQETIVALRNQQQEFSNQLNTTRQALQQLRGEQSSLQALQQTALGQRDQRMVQWLAKHQLDSKPRLAQGIEVDAGWELAVEKVLGSYLQAVCVDSFKGMASQIAELQEGQLSLYMNQSSQSNHATKGVSLLSKVKSKWPLDSLLSGVYVTESLEEALTLSQSLEATESVITREGIWLGAQWLRVARLKNPEEGVFLREQELKKINQRIAELVTAETALTNQLQTLRETLQSAEKEREEVQKIVNECQSKAAQMTATHKMKNERFVELKKRGEQCLKELDDAKQESDQTMAELSRSKTAWEKALHQVETAAIEKDKLMAARDELKEAVIQAKNHLNEAASRTQQFEIRFQTAKSQLATMRQTLNRLRSQQAAFHDRKTQLEQEFQALQSTEAMQESLSVVLNQRLLIEEELQAKRQAVDTINHDMRSIETRRQETERDISKFRDRLESLRVEWQVLKSKSDNLAESIAASQFLLEDILKELPQDAQSHDWQAQLDQVIARINRLGPINLVAIEEHAMCLERKQYLDKQHDDLMQGLTTLEEAMGKIDRETRTRFKETFDKVNSCFEDLFPKIFGGGRAYIELTSDNLLEAGVAVMACPPGKRNSTIHLLSGGEKAMTAIALVFSIFQLNPAPFCLLDEVDAPLDDANVGRYCQLVKAMSDKTQFIFISHNKLAIEMAEHLIGVTMNEPGVSRLVSVNIQEAIQMAGA